MTNNYALMNSPISWKKCIISLINKVRDDLLQHVQEFSQNKVGRQLAIISVSKKTLDFWTLASSSTSLSTICIAIFLSAGKPEPSDPFPINPSVDGVEGNDCFSTLRELVTSNTLVWAVCKPSDVLCNNWPFAMLRINGTWKEWSDELESLSELDGIN